MPFIYHDYYFKYFFIYVDFVVKTLYFIDHEDTRQQAGGAATMQQNGSWGLHQAAKQQRGGTMQTAEQQRGKQSSRTAN